MLNVQEAATALTDVDVVGRRSRQAYGYSLSAPYCFVWGAAWMVGYGGEALFRSQTGWIWLGALLAGAAASIAIGTGQKGRGARSISRVWLLFAVIYAFSFALFAVMPRANALQMGAYWPLLWAAIYAGLGLWLGVRYLLVGLVLAAATLGGYFLLREYFFLWMAAIGGGSLFLTGFWLRQA